VFESSEKQTGYSHDLVDPNNWTDQLDACASTGATSYEFTAADATALTATGCQARLTFPAEGSYSASVTVTGPAGTDIATETVVVEDLLIVGLGDSAASGEGNPDGGDGFSSADWHDSRCHRSMKSGMARAAAKLETSQRSVTFVSFACSGAEIEHILDKPYGGIAPEGGRLLPPQLDAINELLCDGPVASCVLEPRPVDAVWISVGINDVKFSEILIDCANPLEDNCDSDSQTRAKATNGMTEIRNRARELDAALEAPLVDEGPPGPLAAADVSITEYPDDPFDGEKACGAFDLDIRDILWPNLPLPITQGVIEREADWLHETGVRLNALVKELSVRHGWRYVDGISEEFAGNGYCSSDPWLRRLSESFLTQGDYRGVMHPNAAGHQNIEAHILDTFASPAPPQAPSRKVSVVVEAVRVTDSATVASEEGVDDDERRLVLPSVLASFKQGVVLESRYVNTPTTGTMLVPLGAWVTLSPQPRLELTADNLQTVTVETFTVLPAPIRLRCYPQDEDCSPRPARRLNAKGLHKVSDGSPGEDRIVTATAEGSTLEVRYHLTISPRNIGPRSDENQTTGGVGERAE